MSLSAQPKASLFIDGEYVEGEGPELAVLYPFTGETIATLREASPEQVERACASARRAQVEWAAMAPVERGRILSRAVRIIEERNEELARLETLDTGKPIQETLVADWPSGAEALEYYAGLAATVTGQMIPLGQDWAYTRREPLGVCAGIGAWNYPSQIACWKAAPALAMGNSMVYKPSEETPLGALKLAEIFIEAGVPAGVYNVVQGRGQVGASLVTNPDVAKVSLTGSVPTGRKVYTAAAEGMRHVTMELGGKSPLIVFDDANLEDAVSAAILANFYSSGQICSNGTRVFLQEGIKQRFLDRLVERVRNIRMGDPLDPDTNHGPMINAAQTAKIRAMIEGAEAAGARMVCGGTGEGAFIPPTVFADATDDMEIARDEIFGPVMTTLSFFDEEEVVRRANDTGFGLAAGVFTQDLTRAHRVIGNLQAGTCWINTYNLTPVQMPFGGVKMSGVGRENSAAAIEHYSQLKSVYVGMGGVDAPY
ncbi:betaine-aldehyde dehydrogenase [Paracoccus zeaxanthinifaciens]|uniref:betaine-aldehyde dehydrogenase n=1 Tax=Paracoccus zeaxanthinifaciens TaxID=187400 RepID=UPI0003B4A6CB|nr:betaine-aldehyde dehydrogenase [Paracoccus zeaxanthinifaciens]